LVRIRDYNTWIVTLVRKRCTLSPSIIFSAAAPTHRGEREQAMPAEPIEVARNEWGAILHHPEWRLLELKWFPSTRQMTDEDFKASLELYTTQAERLQPITFMLIDATEFFHAFADGAA